MIKRVVADHKNSVLQIFNNFHFAIYFDEASEANSRIILNIIRLKLDGQYSQTYLLESIELEITNSSNVVRCLDMVASALFTVTKD